MYQNTICIRNFTGSNSPRQNKINSAKETGHRVIAVGTTSTRTLEAASDENGFLRETSGWTEIFILSGLQV